MTTLMIYRCPICKREYGSRVVLSAGYPKCSGNDHKHSPRVMEAIGHRTESDKP